MQNNAARAFSEVVSVDGWRADFDENGHASVHVDVSFFEGLVGAEDEFEITFRVSLNRAVLRLVIPETEPIAVIQSTVDREPTVEKIRKIISESRVGKSGGVALNAQLANPTKLGATGNLSAAKETARESRTESTETISQFDIRQFKDRENNYCWEISGHEKRSMKGKVWDPVDQPRLSVKQTTKTKLDPVMQVHVLCRRCDLRIEDVRQKNGSAIKNKFLLNREAAAKAAIKERILDEGLNHPSAENDLIEIQIAESLIIEEIS